MIDSIQEKYLEIITDFSKSLKSIERKIKIVSYSRLALAIGAILSFYYAITYDTRFFYLLLLLIATFAFLAFFHHTLFRKRQWMHNTIQINKDELKYLNQNYSAFEAGSDYINYHHPYSFDLDLFGKDSLYQSICRAVTLQGKRMLADVLSSTSSSSREIRMRQEAIRELSAKITFRQHFQAIGMMLKENATDHEKLVLWLKEPSAFIHHKLLSYVRWIMPAFTLIFLSISVAQGEVHPLFPICILANWIIYGVYGKKINYLYSLISKKKLLLDNYSELFGIAHQEAASARELSRIQQTLENAQQEYHRLASYVGYFDQRLNILVSPFVNSIFLFDIQCCFLIEKWREKNNSDVSRWMDALSSLDMLCSLANFAYNNPEFTYPEIEEQGAGIEAYGIAHPLIKNTKRIPNDFLLGKPSSTAVITGANMAGKSTFLRTIGMNVVLAYTGAPVCATRLRCSLVQIISSMRINDSLKDDVSYFYAELQRLKTIKVKVAEGKPMLILLDEMLRGTNSKDKQMGSKAFVENLLSANCLVMVATHDLLLGQLEDEHPGKIKNYSFESNLQGDRLLFDYKIHQGIARNTNASFLMKDLGII